MTKRSPLHGVRQEKQSRSSGVSLAKLVSIPLSLSLFEHPCKA